MEQFCKMISKLENLERLEIPDLLFDNPNNVYNLKNLNQSLKKLRNFKHLGLPGHELYQDRKTIKALIRLVKDRKISSLDLSQEYFCSYSQTLEIKHNFSLFVKEIMVIDSLEILNSDCSIFFNDGRFIIKTIRKYIRENKKLKNLSLRYCNILNNKISLEVLIDLVKSNNTLELLGLSYNEFCRNPRNIKSL